MLMLVGDWTYTCRNALVRGPEDLGDRLVAAFGALPQEVLVTLVLGPERRVLECALAALGRGNVASASPADVFRRAVQLGGSRVVITHNHPSGLSVPSDADLALTSRLIQAGRLLELELIDHLIVTRCSWRSLRESTSLWEQAADYSLCPPH